VLYFKRLGIKKFFICSFLKLLKSFLLFFDKAPPRPTLLNLNGWVRSSKVMEPHPSRILRGKTSHGGYVDSRVALKIGELILCKQPGFLKQRSPGLERSHARFTF